MVTGRWPANVILSPAMAEVLDGQSGYQRDGVAVNRNRDNSAEKAGESGWGHRKQTEDKTYGSGGGASRYFLTAGYEPWELEWILANGLVPYPGTV